MSTPQPQAQPQARPRPASIPAIAPVLAVVALIVGTAVFLSRFEGMRRVGQPGVKVVAQNLYDEGGTLVATNAVYLPDDLPGYLSTNVPLSRSELDWLPKDTTFGRAFYLGTNGFGAMLSAVLMGVDRTSIHKPEYCLVGQGFRVDSQTITRVAIREPVPYDLPVMKMVTSRETKLPDGSVLRRRVLYVYWFVADGRLSADHNKRMVSMAMDLVLTGVLQRWAYIACMAECQPGNEDAVYAQMERLIAAAVPRFHLAPETPPVPRAELER